MKKLTKVQRQVQIEALNPIAEARYAEQNLLPRLRALIAEQNALVAERKTWSLDNPFDIRPNSERLYAVNQEIDQIHQAIHQIGKEVYGDL